MGTGLGLQSVLGYKAETTYGTAVTVDRFVEFLSESLERRQNVLQSNGIRGGQSAIHARRGSRRAISSQDGGGQFSMEIPKTGFGVLLNQLMGGTATVAQQGGTIAYLQTHAWASGTGKSMTIQKQIRDQANAEVESFTFKGSKVTGAEFSISVDQLAQATFDIDSRQVVTDVAMASPSFTSPGLFSFAEATVKLAGVAATVVTDCSVRFDRPQNTDKRYLGNQGLKNEPYENDFPQISGTITADFDNPATIYDRWAADTALSFELLFEGSTIASTFKETFKIAIPEIRFTGETPKTGGPDVLTVSAPFEGFYDGSSADATITYMSTDTAI